MKEGLSSNQVNDIALDHHGFLLLATSQGLCKYDGREVTLIRQVNIRNFETLGFSSLCVDQHHKIWIGTTRGAYIMDESGTILQVRFPSPDSTMSVRKILRMNNDLIFYTSKGWFLKKEHQDTIESHPFLGKLVGKRALQDISLTPSSNMIAVYSERAVIQISLKDEKVVFDIPVDLAYSATSLEDGRVACGTGTGKIFLLHQEDGRIDQVFQSTKLIQGVLVHKAVNDICMTGPNQLAYTSEDDGMTLLDITTGEEQLFVQDIHDPNSLSSNQTVRILPDHNGNYYVTTLFNGIDFFNLSRYFIRKKIVFVDDHHETFVSYVNSIAEDADGKLWIGASDRVIEYDPASSNTRYHFYYEQVGHYNVNTKLGFKTTCVDLRGRIWQGSFKGGIVIYDPASGQSVKLTKHKHQGGIRLIPASYIWHLSRDHQGMIWVAHNLGFMRVDPVTLEVDTLSNHPVLCQLPRKRGRHIMEDSQGRMWFATHFLGIYRYDQLTQQLDTFNANNGLGNYCYELREDRFGRIYVAHEYGFSVIEEGDAITTYSTNNGLRNRMVEGFLFDDHDNVFIANHNTIIQFNPVSKQFKYFDEQFGIGDVSFISNTAIRSHTGEMVWGTENGFIAFDPNLMTASSSAPSLAIYSISSSRGIKFTSNEDIRISTDEALTFEFSSVDLFGSKNITYQYRLSPKDMDWINLSTENRVTFSSLSRGKYAFHVRASINGVDWIESDQVPAIHITMPFYRNPVVYLSAGILTLGLIGFGWYQRRTNQLKETLFRQQVSELEIKAIRAQMNPHFVFNALNSIQYFTYSGNVDKANEYLNDFAKLMRLVLQQSRDGFISLENEVELLERYLKIEALRFTDDFMYTIRFDGDFDDAAHIYLPSMVIQPFVENAIKHGLIPKKGKKELNVTFYTHEGLLYCDIRDNGIGIRAAQRIADEQQIRMPQTSMGMDLVRKRLNMASSKDFAKDVIEVKEPEPPETGTIITISLPVKL